VKKKPRVSVCGSELCVTASTGAESDEHEGPSTLEEAEIDTYPKLGVEGVGVEIRVVVLSGCGSNGLVRR
jgi:hypothetical protein